MKSNECTKKSDYKKKRKELEKMLEEIRQVIEYCLIKVIFSF